MELKLEDGLKTLLETGKHKGYLTYAQVKEYVPDDSSDSGHLDRILQKLEEMGIDLIEESDADERENEASGEAVEEVQAELDLAFVDDGDGRHIDDPVRMYLTQMGEIPLLTRDEEIALAKKIEITRKSFRRKVLECDYCLAQCRRDAQAGSYGRTAVRPHDENLAHRGSGEGQDLASHAAQLEDARASDGSECSATSRSWPDEKTNESDRAVMRDKIKIRRRKTVTLLEELSIRTRRSSR